MQYDDAHRAFLQAFHARGCMTVAEAKAVLAAILTVHGMRPSHRSRQCNFRVFSSLHSP